MRFGSTHCWLWSGSATACCFARRCTKKRLSRWISRSFYGCFFCLMTCFSLGLVIWQWRTIPGSVWHATGIAEWMIWFAFLGSWVGLFYSLSLTGLGYQTGFTEWIHWVRRKPLPPRTFTPRGAFFILRHPVYLSFLGLLWFTPSMTADRALLTGFWTVYIYIGSWLKDLRLAYYLGDSYCDYASRVPGYPGMLIGPLARWRSPTKSAPGSAARHRNSAGISPKDASTPTTFTSDPCALIPSPSS